MLKQLDFERRHRDMDGNSGRRCSDTRLTREQTVIDLERKCALHGGQVVYRETRLSDEEIPNSNMPRINGAALESSLPSASAASSHCATRSEFTGKPTSCRTVRYPDQVHASNPVALIRGAACRVANCR